MKTRVNRQPTMQPHHRNDPVDLVAAIYVEQGCEEMPYTRDILGRAGSIPVRIVDDHVVPHLATSDFAAALTEGKRHLLLCRNRGRFLKPCPGTREYLCCGYQVINIGMNCPMDCVYCILQAYLNNPWLSFFVNIDDLLNELDHAVRAQPTRFWRIGTGEFTDSLALDRLTGLSAILVKAMADKPNAVLELKTKTAAVANLQGLEHNGRTIVAWSLNSPHIVVREEHRTASIAARLAAAADCAAWGYKLAFHFDPIIDHPDWEAGYADTIHRLFDAVPSERIAWISLGGLRYLPALKGIATERFPGSRFLYEEFITGLDGKNRYFRERRVRMYKALVERIAARAAPRTCVYLCMESPEIWQGVFGFTPQQKGGLAAMLNQAAAGSA